MLQVDEADFLLQLASAPDTQLDNGQTVENICEWLGGMLPSGSGRLSAVAPRGDHDTNRDNASASVPAGGATGVAFSPLGVEPENATRCFSHAKVASPSKDRRGLAQPQIVSRAESMQNGDMAVGSPRSHELDQVLFTFDKPELGHYTTTWTAVTNDSNLILHLLALYFCWEYPIFAPLSKKHFLQDFRDGRHRYCSSLLVNALLALGCRFSTHSITSANFQDSHLGGDHFFKESQRLLDQETEHHSLTTIQALGIMSIREASCGRASESRYYAAQSTRLAFEIGLHRTHDKGVKDEFTVQLATLWGAFSLDM
jgi:hypothetical protein